MPAPSACLEAPILQKVYAVDVNAKFGYLEAAMEVLSVTKKKKKKMMMMMIMMVDNDCIAFATIGAVAAYKSAKFEGGGVAVKSTRVIYDSEIIKSIL
eukprot:jgi/Bigna1/145349/aug1.98_g20057